MPHMLVSLFVSYCRGVLESTKFMDDVFEGCTSTIHSFIHSLNQMKNSNSGLEAACPVAGTTHPLGPQEMGHIRVFMTESLGMVWTLYRGQSGIH